MSYLGRSAKLSLKAQEKVSFLATAGQTVKTGLSYVPNFVEVYVNGILLTDTTDFTATNGNSVTFTVALSLNDEVTVISLKTFSVADHYTKTEDDALLAAKATIASPVFTGNVGISVTPESWSSNNPALQIGSGGVLYSHVSNGTRVSLQGNAYVNSSNADAYITTNEASQHLQEDGTHLFKVAPSGTADAAITWTTGLEVLASGKARAKNGLLFGTDSAAANVLDDYEEGTWTPSLNTDNGNATTSVGNSTGYYTKIGSQVTVWWYSGATNISAAGSGTPVIAGLPFTPDNSGNKYGNPVFGHTTAFNTDPNGYARANGNAIAVVAFNSISSNALVVGTKYIMVTCTYSVSF